MKTEIEVKFLRIDTDEIRQRLETAGAVVQNPMRLMRRAIVDYPDKRLQRENNGFIRVRDEGDRVTLTYKQFDSLELDGAKELETTVGSFDETLAILQKAGLTVHSIQESKRETWRLGRAEVMLDEWPWLPPFMEIEAEHETLLRETAATLGLVWSEAVTGDVMVAYRHEYPKLPRHETVGNLAEVRFGTEPPRLFTEGTAD